MKKILIIMIAIFLVACGNNDNNNGVKDVDVGKDDVTITTDAGQEIVVTSDMDESIALPEGYPSNIIPIYKGAFLAAASVQQDGSYMVIGYTKASMLEVTDFYVDVLEDADVTMEQRSSETYINMGDYKGMTYNVAVAENLELEDYVTAFTIIIVPSIDMDNDTEEDNSTESETSEDSNSEGIAGMFELVIPAEVVWPENYPADQVPIYSNNYTEVKMAMSQGSDNMVALMTEDDIEMVSDHYKAALNGADDYSEVAMQGGVMYTGTVDGKMITVMLIINDGSMGEDERFKTLIQIIYN